MKKIWFSKDIGRNENNLLISNGRARKLFRGCYTSIMSGSIETVIRNNIFEILKNLYPKYCLYGISAFKKMPMKNINNDTYYILIQNAGQRRKVSLPGLDIILTGHNYVDEKDYNPYISDARMLLENLSETRLVSGVMRTVDHNDIIMWMEKICRDNPENHNKILNDIRNDAYRVASKNDMNMQYELLNEMISKILGSHPVALQNEETISRLKGRNYDPDCLGTIKKMLDNYMLKQPEFLKDPTDYKSEGARFQDFMESYFSNYIEGTKFLFDDAENIVIHHNADNINKRKYDAADILNTYDIISRYTDFASWNSFDEYIQYIKKIHNDLMGHRKDVEPGVLKVQRNMAGNTVFVRPELVMGTLEKGYNEINSIDNPFVKALIFHYMMIHVHPFNDGNGRLSRIIMNSILVKNNMSRIIIPNVGREDYINGIKEIINRNRFDVFYRSMLFFQKVTQSCFNKNEDTMLDLWTSTYAFQERDVERLRMPINGLKHKMINGIPHPEDWTPNEDFSAKIFQ